MYGCCVVLTGLVYVCARMKQLCIFACSYMKQSGPSLSTSCLLQSKVNEIAVLRCKTQLAVNYFVAVG